MTAQLLTSRMLCLAIGYSVCTITAMARDPEVTFDFARVAECREVAPSGVEELFPDEKMVELKLRVSVHLIAGNLGDVKEVRIEANDCDSRIRVHSFSPTTRLESPFSEDIRRTTTVENGKSLGASLGGKLPVPAGEFVASVTPTLGGELSNREIVTEVEKRVAPQQAVVASGTIYQEHGVFFKLRRSPQSSLEGVHELTIRFIVPQEWRADSLRLCCSATGFERVLWTKQETTWSQTCAKVALYLAGDADARQAAVEHVKGVAM